MPKLSYPIPFMNRLLGETRGSAVLVSDHEVQIGETRVPHETAGAWEWHHYWFWARVEFRNGHSTGASFLLGPGAAKEFVASAGSYRVRGSLRAEIRAASRHLELWENMTHAERYVPHHEVEDWVDSAALVLAPLTQHLNALGAIDPTCPTLRLASLVKDAHAIVARRNDGFVRRELARREPWFAALPQPPTSTQREIAIRDETNALVVAGAGTGKTATIITKVRYLVEAGLAVPGDILVLAFNADAAEEIRRRCSEGGVEGVNVLTFHALGLRILGAGPGEKPPVLTEVATDESRTDLIAKLVASLLEQPDFAENYAKFVALYARPMVDRFNSSSEAEYVNRTKATLKPALSGDWVRSSEELRIANWLYAHAITFEYEKPFPVANPGDGRTRYRPDFTITVTKSGQNGQRVESVVFLEHQALNEQGEAPQWMKGYREKVNWARSVHAQHRTTLVESFSWWFQSGVWEEKLAAALKQAGVPVSSVDWRSFLRAIEKNATAQLTSDRRLVIELIRRVLDLSRCSSGEQASEPVMATGRMSEPLLDSIKRGLRGLTSAESLGGAMEPDRIRLFDEIFHAVQGAYEAHKHRRQGIDFEDMITLARRTVRRGAYRAAWSHYIIDEFQDASLSRLDLIQQLRCQRRDARLLCVGDDWQAIIRFAGGDIRVMTQFADRVGPHWRIALEQTFRYSPVIAALSTEFVTTNPNQIKKSITPAVGRRNLPVRIVFAAPQQSGDTPDDSSFNDVLATELRAITTIMPDASVLLLSRYRRGIPARDEQQSIQRAHPRLKLAWSTVHRAKGGEADAVIVADLDDDEFGFPCQREDDPIIRRYLPPEDGYEHAEERRLLYVAMTRARHRLTLVASATAPSAFVRELIERHGGRPGLEVVRSGDSLKACPKCRAGVLLARDGTNGRFYSCSKSPACAHKEEACPACRRGFLVAEGPYAVCSRRQKGDCTYQVRICPRCHSGWLVTKNNRQNGRQFLGCSRFQDEDVSCRYTENL